MATIDGNKRLKLIFITFYDSERTEDLGVGDKCKCFRAGEKNQRKTDTRYILSFWELNVFLFAFLKIRILGIF